MNSRQMSLDNPFGNRQTETGPTIFAVSRAIYSIKAIKDFRYGVGRNADTCICYFKIDAVTERLYRDDDRTVLGCVLDCIIDQYGDHTADHGDISHDPC